MFGVVVGEIAAGLTTSRFMNRLGRAKGFLFAPALCIVMGAFTRPCYNLLS